MGNPISTSWIITDSSNMGAVGRHRLEPPTPTQPCLLLFDAVSSSSPQATISCLCAVSLLPLLLSFLTSWFHRHAPQRNKRTQLELRSTGSSIPSKPSLLLCLAETKPQPDRTGINPSSSLSSVDQSCPLPVFHTTANLRLPCITALHKRHAREAASMH